MLNPCGPLTFHQPKLRHGVSDCVMHMPFIWGTVGSNLESCVLNESVDAFSASVVMIVTLCLLLVLIFQSSSSL
jgi:hypothetical protein